MKKILMVTIILIVTIIIQMQLNFVYAIEMETPSGDVSPDAGSSSSGTRGGKADWSGHTSDFWDPGKSSDGEKELKERAGRITTIIRNIGIVITVIALMGYGIRIMFASVEEKSDYKKALPIYILGAIMVIAITSLPSLIYNVTSFIR